MIPGRSADDRRRRALSVGVGGGGYVSSMSRFRLLPTPAQQVVLSEHCRHARFVWNLAVEQQQFWQPGRRPPGYNEQSAQLTEIRAEYDWLAAGSQTVQQQALRDFTQAMRNFFAGTHGRPSWRKAGVHEGFRQVGAAVTDACGRWVFSEQPDYPRPSAIARVETKDKRQHVERRLGLCRIPDRCSGRTLTLAFPTPPTPQLWTAGTPADTVGTLTMTQTLKDGGGMECQRALAVRNNVAIDISACRYDIANQAVDILNGIAAQIPQ